MSEVANELAAILGLGLACAAWFGLQVVSGALRDKPNASGGPKVIAIGEGRGGAPEVGGCGACSVDGCESRTPG